MAPALIWQGCSELGTLPVIPTSGTTQRTEGHHWSPGLLLRRQARPGTYAVNHLYTLSGLSWLLIGVDSGRDNT